MNRQGSLRIDLAHVPPFALGELWVEPAHRIVRHGAREQLVEPRVLKVIVAFAEAGNAVLSRDDLIARVWGGRIVGDNAIQRAISRVRELASTIGANSFRIETITGVGYRLHSSEGERQEWKPAFGSTRRSALKTAGALVITAGVVAATRPWFVSGDNATARGLYDRAEVALREEDEHASEQAIALYEAAVEESPRFAEAWSGLALAHCQLLDGVPDEQTGLIAKRAMSATDRSLAIDPNELRAKAAQIVVLPSFGQWRRQLQALRALDRRQNGWELPALQGRLHADIGQLGAAIRQYERAINRQPMVVRVFGDLFHAYWSLDRIFHAERVLNMAIERWPRKFYFWNSRFYYLAISGRYEDAVNWVSSPTVRPLNLSPTAIDTRIELVDILSGEKPGSRTRLVERYMADLRRFPFSGIYQAVRLAAVGARDEMFDALNSYYFAEGPFTRKHKKFSRRTTGWLYMAYFDPYRGDPRFQALTDRIGIPARGIA